MPRHRIRNRKLLFSFFVTRPQSARFEVSGGGEASSHISYHMIHLCTRMVTSTKIGYNLKGKCSLVDGSTCTQKSLQYLGSAPLSERSGSALRRRRWACKSCLKIDLNQVVINNKLRSPKNRLKPSLKKQ